ncbi:Outer membrane protein beta-barrel domain-containing protein [Reichenbachiella faecimaris]|uniref:Outer membrane protein beta-barrel domain-containing protein n=1 Tax=Reichenbachiella faecimaris TaxID=692418 RepID=A0A1W2GDZ7_REIFA|nr:hypothetical protein [Reichenbachiella faecimaris]SMD34712.1 Outer membrane protein beta-barrel domain-containing protein [Reichenbachiella faecimaris]
MSKLLLPAFLMLSFVLHAQDSTKVVQFSAQEYKVDFDETTLEVQFAPFGSNPISLNGIRARWFSSPYKAFRLNVFAGLDSDTQITQQKNTNASLKELKDKFSTFSINVRPGFERHLKGTDRLSPYFGTEFDLAFQSSSDKSEFQDGDDVEFTKRVNENGFIRFGLNFVAGFDFYVAKKLYLGTEFGYGFSYTKLLDVKVKSDRSGFTEPEPEKRGGAFDLGPNVNAQIRLGYAF